MDPSMMSLRLTETQLEECERLATKPDLSDPVVAQAWALRAAPLMSALADETRRLLAADGGPFGVRLRSAIMEEVLADINGRVQLTEAVTEHSLTVHLTGPEVIVDVRLKLGKWSQ